MNYEIFTDSSSNLTPDLVREAGVQMIPLHYVCQGAERPAYDERFDARAFYDLLRNKIAVKTSMINVDQFLRAFEPVVQAGRDILYIAMSSGISGTVEAGRQAARHLMDKYPGRAIQVADTLAASFGEGLFVLKAAAMRAAGDTLKKVSDFVHTARENMNQYFTVDDLMFLRRGGRLSGLSAVIGSIANIKPLLKGNPEGKIVPCGKLIGRKRSLNALADEFDRRAYQEEELVAIAHGDCEEDANYLAAQLRRRRPIKEILIRCYEPGTGAHVGPGTVALFFFGKPRTAED